MNDRGYVKLFSKIVTSTMWCEDSDTRVLWVTMLALANRYGDVLATVPGLARVANVDVEKCRSSLKKFMEPDPDSRTKVAEGRRIIEIEGGWNLINYEMYRDLMSTEERKEYKRVKEAERRERLKTRGQDVDKRGQNVDSRGQQSENSEERGQTVALQTSSSDFRLHLGKTHKDASVTPVTNGNASVTEPKDADASSVCDVSTRFKRPTINETSLYASKIGLPESEVDKFMDYYTSNGWKVGKNPMRSWEGAMRNWKRNWEERREQNSSGTRTAKNLMDQLVEELP